MLIILLVFFSVLGLVFRSKATLCPTCSNASISLLLALWSVGIFFLSLLLLRGNSALDASWERGSKIYHYSTLPSTIKRESIKGQHDEFEIDQYSFKLVQLTFKVGSNGE
jgi:hypothetical protein